MSKTIFEVEGVFSAQVEAENGEEIKEIFEKIQKPDNVKELMVEAEEWWPSE